MRASAPRVREECGNGRSDQCSAGGEEVEDDDDDEDDSRIGDSEEGKARRLTFPGSNLALSSPASR